MPPTLRRHPAPGCLFLFPDSAFRTAFIFRRIAGMKPLRSFVAGCLAVLLFGVASSDSLRASEYAPNLGIQTWTLRNLNFDEVVEFAKRHDIKYLQMIGSHMNPHAPLEETKAKKAIGSLVGVIRPR